MKTTLAIRIGGFLVALMGAGSFLAAQEPEPKFSLVGTWRSKEPTSILGNPAVREIRLTFTADGKYMSSLTTTVTDRDSVKNLGTTTHKGAYTYKSLSQKEGQLEVVLEAEGAFSSPAQRGIVKWVSSHEMKYVLGKREILYRRDR